MAGSEIKDRNKLPDPVVHTCNSCSEKITQKVIGQTVNIGCTHCGTVFNVDGTSLQKAFQFKNRSGICHIPLGCRGVVEDVKYEVIGWMHCKEAGLKYYWSEYVLFNPLYGYAFLSEYNGHWSFNVESEDFPGNYQGDTIQAGEETYRIFSKYEQQVVYAAGEFHWEVNSKYHEEITEYINPPYILVKDENHKELRWFRGKYMQPSEISKIFNVQNLPSRIGVASNQPFQLNVQLGKLKTFIYAAFILLLILQLYFVNSARNLVVFSQGYNLGNLPLPDPAGNTPPITPFTGTFELKDSPFGSSNLEVYLDAPVNNNWMEAAITMTNTRTGESFAFDIGVEYYSGPGWSEGSTNDYKTLSEIPDGNYTILIQPYAGTGSGQANSFNVILTQDVTNWSNFFLLLIALLVMPVVLWVRMNMFETRRWSNSDFAD
jgi:hypothetical protein